MATRILIVDEHRIVREGLSSLFTTRTDMKITALAENGRQAVQAASHHKPDVVILDMRLPFLNGLDAARQMKKRNRSLKIVVLAHSPAKETIGAALRAGALGCIMKNCSFEELLLAVKTVVRGQSYVSPGVSNPPPRGCLPGKRKIVAPAPFSALSPRERETLQLIAEGKSTKETAMILRISIKTVETFRKKIMDKLDIRNIADLTKYALRHGLTAL
jgi:DNA-binding NarL/FixJ family response regulator